MLPISRDNPASLKEPFVRLECLRTVVHSGNASYPVYIGFCAACEIYQVAAAPAFTETTPNSVIAANVLTPPVEDWQRPLIPSSIAAIKATFDDTGRLMPNPVLLAKNPHSSEPVSPHQQTVNGTTPTGIWEIDLPLDPPQVKPLWILDGQHRIHGLNESMQSTNPVPFVLLLNEDANSYAETRLAEIFAQVTTTAASLDPLHNEWMSYAFYLGKYAPLAPDAQAQRSAMAATAQLCKQPQLDPNGTANPFRDRIKFNPKRSPDSFQAGGFAYDCIDMQKLLNRAYFSASPVFGVSKLSPEDVARQMGFAYLALQNNVRAPHSNTVFFGDKDSTQRIMQDAFFVGVLTRLLQRSLPIDWMALLQALKFNSTNWNFKPWVRSVSGTEQTISKKIAERVMRRAFTDGYLQGQPDLVDILRGHDATFTVQIEALRVSGRPDNAATDHRVLSRGDSLNLACTKGVKRRLKILEVADNIGTIEAIDAGASTAARRVKLQALRRSGGLILDPDLQPPHHKNPLSVKFVLRFYGGIQGEADLDVEWQSP
jgi:hypothetical protein